MTPRTPTSAVFDDFNHPVTCVRQKAKFTSHFKGALDNVNTLIVKSHALTNQGGISRGSLRPIGSYFAV